MPWLEAGKRLCHRRLWGRVRESVFDIRGDRGQRRLIFRRIEGGSSCRGSIARPESSTPAPGQSVRWYHRPYSRETVGIGVKSESPDKREGHRVLREAHGPPCTGMFPERTQGCGLPSVRISGLLGETRGRMKDAFHPSLADQGTQAGVHVRSKRLSCIRSAPEGRR